MPVQDCQRDGKPGKKRGNDYVYTPGDKSRTINRAREQGRAIESNKK